MRVASAGRAGSTNSLIMYGLLVSLARDEEDRRALEHAERHSQVALWIAMVSVLVGIGIGIAEIVVNRNDDPPPPAATPQPVRSSR